MYNYIQRGGRIMFCPKCGKELPDSSNFCTACGYKIETNNTQQNLENKNSKTVKVVIIRTKKLIGCGIAMKVHIDGNKIGSLKNSESVEIDLPIGEHKLLIETFGEFTDRVLNLTPDINKVTITVVMKMGLVSGSPTIESVKTE